MGKDSKKSTKKETEQSIPMSDKAVIYRYGKISTKNINVDKFNFTGKQPMAFVNYLNPSLNALTRLYVQTGNIKLVQHGIPSLTDESKKDNNYYPTDDKREFIKIPLDDDQDACKELREFAEAIDAWAGSEKFKKEHFGKDAKVYSYNQCIKVPVLGPDSKAKTIPMNFIKMKLSMRETDSGRVCETALRKRTGDDKGDVENVQASTVTEVANEIRFMTTVKLVFQIYKIWASKTLQNGVKGYGVGIRISAIEYTPSTSRGGINSKSIEFLSDDEDEKVIDNGSSKDKSAKNKSKAKLDDSDDESEDSPKKVTKVKSELDSDSEEDDSGESVDAKKSSKKNASPAKSKNIVDSDNDDESSEEVVNKSNKKSSQSKKKTESYDEEDEDEESSEEIKPSPKKKSKSKSR